MPRITIPIFKGNVKVIAYAMSAYGVYAGHNYCERNVKATATPRGGGCLVDKAA